MNHNSRDDEGVGMAHEVKSPASIFPDEDGAVLDSKKLSPNKHLDRPETFLKICHEI